MTLIRRTRSAARRLPPGRWMLVLTLVLPILAACGQASGGNGY
jgi:hypothetical protein